MASPTRMSSSRTYPMPVEEAFDKVMPLPLEQLFDRRYGPIPSIKATEQDGVWSRVGQTRVIRLTGGGSMREELVSIDRPHSFGYVLTEITGPMSALASTVDGLWSFEPAKNGVKITWQWTMHPKNAFTAPLLSVFAKVWPGYARQALQRIEDRLVNAG